MKKLTEEQMNFFLKNGEFSAEVIASAPNTAVILTQDWCPQWTMMKRYLSEITEAAVFFIEYNREARARDAFRKRADSLRPLLPQRRVRRRLEFRFQR